MVAYLKKNVIKLAIGIVFVLIVLGASLSLYNRQIMREALVVREQSDLALRQVDGIYGNIRMMDISSRGYALIREPQFLFYPVEGARLQNGIIFRGLDSLFHIQGYAKPVNYELVKQGLDQYVNMYARMADHLHRHEDSLYIAMLREDFGKHFWETYKPFADEVTSYEAGLNAQANQRYQKAEARNVMLQLLLALIGLPTLVVIFYTLHKEENSRKLLLLNLEENNKRYLFDDGDNSSKEARDILENSISNLQKASSFVNQISAGNYDVSWEGLNEENVALNQQNLAGRLVFMRDEMKKVKEEDRRRMWSTEGLSKFSEIIRTNQHDLESLTFSSLTFLVKYLRAQQGSLFILEEDETSGSYLRMAACYAFDRKKHLNKRLEIGEGLLGQAYLEADTVLLTDVPQDYISITSGLGDATPDSVVIVPFKYNEQVQALVELASFEIIQPYQIAFLEKAGEFIASAIATAQTNEKTGKLLEQLQAQTEQMRAQEEELRQNMEELEATQEEMRRKELALEKRLSGINAG